MLNKHLSKKLLKFLEKRGKTGVFAHEIYAPKPHGLGIPGYNRHLAFLQLQGYRIDVSSDGIVVLKGFELPVSHRVVQRTTPIQPLQGRQLQKWNRIGGYLRGEAPKPRIRTFERRVLKALT